MCGCVCTHTHTHNDLHIHLLNSLIFEWQETKYCFYSLFFSKLVWFTNYIKNLFFSLKKKRWKNGTDNKLLFAWQEQQELPKQHRIDRRRKEKKNTKKLRTKVMHYTMKWCKLLKWCNRSERRVLKRKLHAR